MSGRFLLRQPLNIATQRLDLDTNTGQITIPLTNEFNGKKVVFWITENSNANITKAAISNYSSTLTKRSNLISSGRGVLVLNSQDTIL